MTAPAEAGSVPNRSYPQHQANPIVSGRPALQITPTDVGTDPRSAPHAGAPLESADDAELMMRVGWDDADAFGQVMQRYWDRTYRYASQIADDSDRAYDIAQEAFARLWEKRCEWATTGSLGGWLLKTARNLAIAEHRKRRVRERWRGASSPHRSTAERTPLEDAEATELRQAIQSAIHRLSPRRREVFTLFHLHQLSYEEIAEVLEIRPQTIANHLHAAVMQLRVALRPHLTAALPLGEVPHSESHERKS